MLSWIWEGELCLLFLLTIWVESLGDFGGDSVRSKNIYEACTEYFQWIANIIKDWETVEDDVEESGVYIYNPGRYVCTLCMYIHTSA
jgi:hypothetical protein